MPDLENIIVEEMLNLQTPVEVFTHSAGNRPAIKAAEFRLQSSEKNLKVTRSAYYPDPVTGRLLQQCLLSYL